VDMTRTTRHKLSYLVMVVRVISTEQ